MRVQRFLIYSKQRNKNKNDFMYDLRVGSFKKRVDNIYKLLFLQKLY